MLGWAAAVGLAAAVAAVAVGGGDGTGRAVGAGAGAVDGVAVGVLAQAVRLNQTTSAPEPWRKRRRSIERSDSVLIAYAPGWSSAHAPMAAARATARRIRR